jgi:hypothetical protein
VCSLWPTGYSARAISLAALSASASHFSILLGSLQHLCGTLYAGSDGSVSARNDARARHAATNDAISDDAADEFRLWKRLRNLGLWWLSRPD